MMYRYIVIVPSIVGNPETWSTEYFWDGLLYKTRDAAIRGGWKIHGHDDWLIGVLKEDLLVRLAWQHDDRDDPEELADAANKLGLKVAA